MGVAVSCSETEVGGMVVVFGKNLTSVDGINDPVGGDNLDYIRVL